MGIEYELRVSESARAAVATAVAQQLESLLTTYDPKAAEPVPHVTVKPIHDGLYVCDHLTDAAVAATVLRKVIDMLLMHTDRVSISEP